MNWFQKVIQRLKQPVIPKPAKVVLEADGSEALQRTENFKMYVCRSKTNDGNDGDVLGAIMLTHSQLNLLNDMCESSGIEFTKK